MIVTIFMLLCAFMTERAVTAVSRFGPGSGMLWSTAVMSCI